jgi:hypothetical protein
MRHSEQQLRARIRRTIRAQWNLNFAWRRSLPGFVDVGHTGRRPLENAAVFFVLLVLPLPQRPCARLGYPHRQSDAVSICVVLVLNETHHPCQMVPSKAASMRRAALPAAARGRPQAARRHRVAAAWCPQHVVRRTSSAATAGRPLQPPPVVRFASDRVALSQRRASITSQARDALCWKACSLSVKTQSNRSVPL